MPRGYSAHSAIIGDPWHRCQRCDCETRVSKLQWQNGILICQECVDNPQAWLRDSLIQDALTNSPEEAQVAEILRGGTNEPEPQIP